MAEVVAVSALQDLISGLIITSIHPLTTSLSEWFSNGWSDEARNPNACQFDVRSGDRRARPASRSIASFPCGESRPKGVPASRQYYLPRDRAARGAAVQRQDAPSRYSSVGGSH